jgi:hypothetical protein
MPPIVCDFSFPNLSVQPNPSLVASAKLGARQISAPSPGGEGWDEGGQLFAPQRHNLIRQKKSVVHPTKLLLSLHD